MRSTKTRRLTNSLSNIPFAPGEIIGITNDFDGGPVLATATVSTSIPSGTWMQIQFSVDGVVQQKNGIFILQTVSSNPPTMSMSYVLRVPQGKHRVGLIFGASTAGPFPGNGAELSISELPA